MDWLAKMLGLPEHFLHHHPSSRGGGVLQVPMMTAFLLTLGPGTGSKDESFPTIPRSLKSHHRHYHRHRIPHHRVAGTSATLAKDHRLRHIA